MAKTTIKVRTQLREGRLTVRTLIRHPMEVGRAREDGSRVPAHFITRVTCRLDGDIVLDADWGGGVSKDPYLSFIVEGVAPGAKLELAWQDNQGGHDELVVAV